MRSASSGRPDHRAVLELPDDVAVLTDPPAPAPAFGVRGITAGGTVWMVAGSLIAAAGAYLFQMVVAQELGSRAYAPISVIWTIQYLMLSVLLYSVETWALRAVAADEGKLTRLRSASRSLVLALVAVGVVLAAISVSAHERLFGGQFSLAGVVILTLFTYTLFVVARAMLAGRNRFKAYGLVTALESVVRFGVVLVVIAVGGGVTAIAWTMPLGALAAAAYWLIARRTRAVQVAGPQAGGDVSGPGDLTAGGSAEQPIRFLLATVPGNACGQILLAGGPLVLAAIGARPEVTSTFFVAITVARIPLVIAQGGLLSRMLPVFASMAGRGDGRGLARWSVLTALGAVLVASLGALVAGAIGPPVLQVLYGADFRPSAWLAAGAAGAVTLSAGSLLLNQVLVACRREAGLLLPWGGALLVAAVTLAVAPGDAEARVLLAMVVGQAVALLALLASSLRNAGQLWRTVEHAA